MAGWINEKEVSIVGMLAWTFGCLGGLGMIAGILAAVGVIPSLGAELTWVFWFALSGILYLTSIAFALGRSGGGED